jgi:hypothetical protein
MTLTLKLTPEEEARLAEAARQKGVDPSEWVRDLLKQSLPPPRPGDATRALLSSWREEDETSDPEAVETAERELEEFKREMDAERSRAGARLLYP